MKKQTKKAEKAAEVAANKFAAYGKKVCALTGWVGARIMHKEMRAAFDAMVSAEEFAASFACKTAVGAAIWPLKVAAVQHAEKAARKTIAEMTAKIKAANWNLDEVAPEGHYHNDPRHVYEAKRDERNHYYSVFDTKRESYAPGAKTIAVRSLTSERDYIGRAMERAADQYDLFVLKLVKKIGPDAVSATLEGNHVWEYSILTITMKDGSVQRWKTQQIMNRSKLGLWFPQWPSRQMNAQQVLSRILKGKK